MTERRRDPVTGEWRAVATHRQSRTFLPPTESCPLCPTRPGGPETEVPWEAFEVAVFENRFPSFAAEPPPPAVAGGDLYRVEPTAGAAEVVVYSDDHEATLGSLGVERVRLLVDVWAERYAELSARDEVGYVFVFENRGEVVGVTLHHPHGQVYGYPDIPPVPARELGEARAHMEATGRCVMCDVVARERAEGVRMVARNDAFLAFVPFAPRFPYEVHVVAHRHAPSLLDLSDPDRDALASLLRDMVRRYDTLFGFTLPYVMGVHQAPTDDGEWQALSHFHVEFTPLHRGPDRLKYLAGSELAAGAFLVDVAPEEAAAALRAAVPAP